jgi:hypothetical protein
MALAAADSTRFAAENQERSSRRVHGPRQKLPLSRRQPGKNVWCLALVN